MTTVSPTRASIVLLLLASMLAGMTTRVAYLQTYGREKIIDSAERQHYREERLLARRGNIYSSDLGLMASTVVSRGIYLDPWFMRKTFAEEYDRLGPMNTALRKLAELIDREGRDVIDLVEQSADERYVRLAQDVSEEICQHVLKLDIPGVGLESVGRRNYPMGSLAAHVLGTVRADGVGLEGIELKFDKDLAGRNGFKRMVKDARRHELAVAAEDYVPPQHGNHLVLTIDSTIQMIAEQELEIGCKAVKATRGEVVVMDPRTGDVLALANWPTFNPQNLADSAPADRCNRALTYSMEPGSVIKPFASGPAMTGRKIRPEEIWSIPGISYTTKTGRRVTDVHGYGRLATWDGLVKSSNIFAVMVAERLGSSLLYQAYASFGFGKVTGIELPGEENGMLMPVRQWDRETLTSMAQGYALMVTPVQLARGFCVYANGGYLVQPRIVKGMLDAQGNLVVRGERPELELLPQVVDRVSAAEMRRILADVPVRGTASGHRSRNYAIFGKTGTAHIAEHGVYSDTKFNSSFICGAPFEDPRLVMCIAIHEADKRIAHYGGAVSAPVAKAIVDRALAYLQVPQSPDLDPPPAHIASVLYNFNAAIYKRPAERATRTASVRD